MLKVIYSQVIHILFSELPLLNNAPDVVNVTCENVTVTWPAWTSGEDKGNMEAIIARYE